MTTAQGAREQPLTFAITTAGWDQQSIAFEQHELTRQVQDGNAQDESFLGVVYGAPMDADWTDESVWRRANPSLGETTSLGYCWDQARRARNQPTEQNAFRTLQLSQWWGRPRGSSLWRRGIGARRGHAPRAIKAVVLTHAHFDHIGFARRAQEELRLPLWAHRAELSVVHHPWRYDHERSRLPYLRHPEFLRIFTDTTAMGALARPAAHHP